MKGRTFVGPLGVDMMSQLVSRVPIAPLLPEDCGPTVTVVGRDVGDSEGRAVGAMDGNKEGD